MIDQVNFRATLNAFFKNAKSAKEDKEIMIEPRPWHFLVAEWGAIFIHYAIFFLIKI